MTRSTAQASRYERIDGSRPDLAPLTGEARLSATTRRLQAMAHKRFIVYRRDARRDTPPYAPPVTDGMLERLGGGRRTHGGRP